MDPIIPQPETVLTPETHKHFLNKKFIITLVILLLLGSGAYAGISYWQNQQSVQVTPTFTPRASALPDPTAGWKTYTNTKYGFEIQIPNDWNVTEENNLLIFKSQKTIAAEVQNGIDCSPGSTKQCNSDGVPADMIFQSISSIKDAASGSVQTKNINGLQFTAYSALGMIEVPTYEINYKNKTYNFSSINMSQIDFENILGTFKFTDSSALFCGGIAGVMCPSGYDCKLDGTYPDAGGTCIKNAVACTQEAKQCSDGSYVGRTGPNCEFTACPGDGTLIGHVIIGPNCPVEKVGNPCTPSPQAYTSRQVMVYKADGTTLVTTKNFDTQGNYNIALPAGTYVVKSKTGISSTASVVGTVIIKNGQTSTLNFNIDTGIR